MLLEKAATCKKVSPLRDTFLNTFIFLLRRLLVRLHKGENAPNRKGCATRRAYETDAHETYS